MPRTHELLVVGRELASRRERFGGFGLRFGERSSQFVDLAGELVGFLALGAKREHPEGDGQRRDEEHRDDQTVGGLHLSLSLSDSDELVVLDGVEEVVELAFEEDDELEGEAEVVEVVLAGRR